MADNRTAWLNGAFVLLADAHVPVMDRGFLFADGVYEVTAVLDGRLVDSAAHLARLERSARELDLTLPLSPAEIEAVERTLIARDGIDQGIVYLQLTRGVAERDFVPSAGLTPTLLLFTQAKDITGNPAAVHGIAVVSLEDIRWARRDIKSVALLAQVLAKRHAAANGAQEAWLVEDGIVTEGASSTAMIVDSAGRLVVRPNSRAILPGCTRAALVALAERDSIEVEERPFTLAEAMEAREAMISSASTLVLPVVTIDGRPVGEGRPGPIAARLRTLYIEAARAAA